MMSTAELSLESINPRSFGTHDGTFHADEVSACALLLLFGLIDRDRIVRSRDESVLRRCEFVCDVGGIYDPSGKRFDHHQAQYQGDKSSAGLILQYLRDCGVLSRADWLFFQDALIAGVDAHDNGRYNPEKGICTFSHIISNFAPVEYEAGEEALNHAFDEALDFALGHLRRSWQRHCYNLSCREQIAQKMAQSHDLLIFDAALPWLDNFFALDGLHHPARFVIMPAGRYWKLRAIPPSLSERMKVRSPMPAAWAGLMDEELARVSGIEGAVFCHKGRFISVWKTLEDAKRAYSRILEEEAL